jgi:hypothetical protein
MYNDGSVYTKTVKVDNKTKLLTWKGDQRDQGKFTLNIIAYYIAKTSY